MTSAEVINTNSFPEPLQEKIMKKMQNSKEYNQKNFAKNQFLLKNICIKTCSFKQDQNPMRFIYTLMLKSPEIKNGSADRIIVAKYAVNSVIKVLTVIAWLVKNGGQ